MNGRNMTFSHTAAVDILAAEHASRRGLRPAGQKSVLLPRPASCGPPLPAKPILLSQFC
jgi:hypothetical protein